MRIEVHAAQGLDLRDRGLEIIRRAREAWAGNQRTDVGAVLNANNETRNGVATLRLAAADGSLDVLNDSAAGADLGREDIGPGGVEAERIIVALRAFVLEAVDAGDRTGGGRCREVVRLDIGFFEVLVGCFQTMVVGDVRIQTAEIPLRTLGKAAGQTASFIAVDVAEDRREAIEIGLRGEGQFVRIAGAGRAVFLRVRQIGLFVSAEEEQAILDDRAAEGHAVALFLIGRRGEIDTVGRVALKAVVGVGEECRTVELVRARLGHDVDGAARELAVLNVERREFDRGFADRVEGDRQRVAAGEGGAVQAEQVRLSDAVDGESVRAVVAA